MPSRAAAIRRPELGVGDHQLCDGFALAAASAGDGRRSRGARRVRGPVRRALERVAKPATIESPKSVPSDDVRDRGSPERADPAGPGRACA